MAEWLTDPEAVAEEYASEEAFRERVLAFRELVEGPNDEEIVRERILAARPRRLLDVGSGLSDLCGGRRPSSTERSSPSTARREWSSWLRRPAFQQSWQT